MSQTTQILQPTAEELMKFLGMASKAGNSVKLTIEVEPPKEWLTSKEAMQLLGVGKTRFYELLNSNAFTPKKEGGRIKVQRESLLKCIDNGLV